MGPLEGLSHGAIIIVTVDTREEAHKECVFTRYLASLNGIIQRHGSHALDSFLKLNCSPNRAVRVRKCLWIVETVNFD